MLKFFAGIGNAVKAVFVLMFPMVSGGRTAWDASGATSRWAMRGTVGSFILLMLWMTNRSTWIGLLNVIKVPPPWNVLFLPALAVCLYGMLWFGWWLWQILNLEIEPPTSEFPDIDRAWAEATAALDKAGIKLDQTPLFLVLGWTIGSEETLFQAAGLKPLVREIPRGQSQPLHVTANHEGVWVTCPGTSLLGRLDPGAGSGVMAGADLDFSSSPEPEAAEEPDQFKTMGVGQAGGTLRIEDFVAQMKKHQGQASARVARKTAVELEPVQARLRRLCRLIARDRKGFCPINGIMIVLPVTCVDGRGQGDELARACSTDLATAFTTFRLRCPVLYLMNKLETLPGFAELIERLPANQRGSRIGQRFPLVPELAPESVPGRVEDAVEWVGRGLFPTMVLSRFQVETPGGEDLAMSMEANARMFRFLSEVRKRGQALAKLVRGGLPNLPAEPVMFGGCYFAAAGRDQAAGQAFASGVFSRMVRDQDNVTWTAEVLQDDARRLRRMRTLRIALILYLTAATLGIVGYVGWTIWGSSSER